MYNDCNENLVYLKVLALSPKQHQVRTTPPNSAPPSQLRAVVALKTPGRSVGEKVLTL